MFDSLRTIRIACVIIAGAMLLVMNRVIRS
jgi:hypothetical protein